MRILEGVDLDGRRAFLLGTCSAVLVTSSQVLLSRAALAQTPGAVASGYDALIRMARDLFPHSRLADDQYRMAIAAIDDQLAADTSKSNLLRSGAALLDDAARKAHGRPYLAVERAEDRALVLKTIESSDFFKSVRSGLVTSLYNQQPLWERFGYEGSSAEKGGYLRRSFDDIDWLPA